MPSIKITINKESRRVNTDHLPRPFEKSLYEFIRENYPSVKQFTLKYEDEEGDLVSVREEQDLQDAMEQAQSKSKCLKLIVVETEKPDDVKQSEVKAIEDKKESKEIKEESPEKPKEESPEKPKESKEKPKEEIVSPLNVEFNFQSDTKRVVLDREKLTIPYLAQEIAKHFPATAQSQLLMKYRDDEGDNVTISNQDDLSDGLELNSSLLVLVISCEDRHPEAPSSKEDKKQQKAADSQPQVQPQAPPASSQGSASGRPKKRWEDVTWDELNESLNRLQSLGFKDAARNSALLEKHSNDLDQVISELSKQ